MGNSVSSQMSGKSHVLVQALGDPQYLNFLLGGEMFAIEILTIREIIEYGGLVTGPMLPASIRGAINLRGEVVPVIDLSVRFGRASVTLTRRICFVIIEIDHAGAQQNIGVVVDSVSEVLDIPADRVDAALRFGARIRTDFIQGMAKLNEHFIIILNVHQELSVHEMERFAQAEHNWLSELSSDAASLAEYAEDV